MRNVFTCNSKTVYPIIFEVNYGTMKSINCYLFDDGNSLTLIDAGIDLPEFHHFFEGKLNEFGFTYSSIDQILLTHHHEDHVGVVNKILSYKEVPVYAHERAIERLYFDHTFLTNKLHFFQGLYQDYGCVDEAADRLKKLQQTIEVGHFNKIKTTVIPLKEGDFVMGMQVFEVPGHSPDSILFYDQETQWCFSGDLAFKWGTPNALIDFSGELQLLPTVSQQQQSLLKIKELEISCMFPGHQETFEDYVAVLQYSLDRIEKKCSRVVEAVANGHTDVMSIAYAIYGKRVEKLFHLILSEIIGYTELAIKRGVITQQLINGQWTFSIS